MSGLTPRSRAHWHGPTVHADHFLYRFFDADGALLYIGCTHDPKRRIAAHLSAGNSAKASRWIRATATRHEVDAKPHRGRDAGRNAEHDAIQAEWPLFNYQQQAGPDRAAWMTRTPVARYLVERGEIALALETVCTCWTEVRRAGAYMESCFAHVAGQVAGLTNLRPESSMTDAEWESVA